MDETAGFKTTNAAIEFCSQMSSDYLEAISTLLSNLDQHLSILEGVLAGESHPSEASERTYYVHMVRLLGKFSIAVKQNVQVAGLDLSKVRICMLVNEHVLGVTSTTDAVALARMSTSKLGASVLACVCQLKNDLVSLKGKVVGVDEFEHFATNMAVIKINRVLTVETKSLRRAGLEMRYFDMVLDSPNENKLTSMHLAAKSPRAGKRKTARRKGGVRVLEPVFGSGNVPNSAKSPMFSPVFSPNPRVSLKLKPKVKQGQNMVKWDELLGRVASCRQALEKLQAASDALFLHSYVCSTLWWQLLGNNQYDYGVSIHCEKWRSVLQAAGQLKTHLSEAVQRWQRMERAVRGCCVKRRFRALLRFFLVDSNEGADETCSSELKFSEVRRLIAAFLQDDLGGCLQAIQDVAATFIGGARVPRGCYSDIVAEYKACVEFSAGLMCYQIGASDPIR